MKKLAIIFFLLWKSVVCISQIYLPVTPTDYGTNFNRIKPFQSLHIPFGDTLMRTTDTSAQLRVFGGQLYYHSGYWRPAGGGKVPGLQEVLDAGDSATDQNISMGAASQAFWTNMNSFGIYSNNSNTGQSTGLLVGMLRYYNPVSTLDIKRKINTSNSSLYFPAITGTGGSVFATSVKSGANTYLADSTGVLDLSSMGVGGKANAQQMTYWSDSNKITGSSRFQVDTAMGNFGIGGTPTWRFHMFYNQPRGTVSYTNGSTAVTGVGTDFQKDLHIQQGLNIGGYNAVQSINSPTSFTLGAPAAITGSNVQLIVSDNYQNGSFQIANNGDIYRDNIPILKMDGGNAANVAVGTGAMSGNISSTRNTAFGQNALYSTTTSSGNTAIGMSALYYNNNGSGNVAVGYYSGAYSNGNNNAFVGANIATNGLGSGGQNSALGAFSLSALTDGGYNTAVGENALSQLTTGNTNTAVGYNALAVNSASNNVAVGGNALVCNNTGTSNTGVGYYSLFTSGTGVGSVTVTNGGSGYTNATTIVLYGTNPEVGQAAAVPVIVGGVITAINVTFQSAGYKSAPVVTIQPNGPGSGATAVANLTSGTGAQNTAFGENAGYNVFQGVGNVYIGNNVRGKVNTSNKLYISNKNDSDQSLIYGDFSNRYLNINGTLNLQAGTASQSPLNIPPGVYKSVPVNGDVENDGNNLKYTANGASGFLATAPVTATLSSDYTTTNGTLADVTGLSVPTASNAKYRIDIMMQTGCSTANGIKASINLSSGSLLAGNVIGNSSSTSAVKIGRMPLSNGGSTGTFNAFIGNGTMNLQGYFTTTSAGTATLQFAAVTAGDTGTLSAGTTIQITRVF